jgi:aspartyl protease family protein
MDGGGQGSGGGCLWSAVFMLGVLGLVVALMLAFPQAGGGSLDWSRLVYLVLLLMVVTAGVGAMFRADLGRTLRHAAIWMAVVAGLALLYSFRHELGMARDRVVGNVAPATPVVQGGGREVMLVARDGHFMVEAEVEGRAVLFLVDTGASDVVLTEKDARRIGIHVGERDFTRRYQTAGGTVRGAPVVLDSVAIGPIDLRNVEASVAEGEHLGVSLLGMSFLGRLGGYAVERDRLTLRQ